MQRPWTADCYAPTIYRTNPAQTAPVPLQVPATLHNLAAPPRLIIHQSADHHIRHVRCLTENLSRSGRDPDLWRTRAEHLLTLGYPELAAGDAYKAILLHDYPGGLIPDAVKSESASWSQKSPGHTTNCNLEFAYRTLIQALYDCHCHPEALDICNEAGSRFPDQPFFHSRAADLRAVVERKRQHVATSGETRALQRDMLYDGAVLTIPYPWMEPGHLRRSASLVDRINQEFRRTFQSCRLDNSSLSGSPPTFSGHDPQVLGVFADREIDPGECILVDRTATGASSSVAGCVNCFKNIKDAGIEAACCSAIFCSEDCRKLAVSTYHAAVCRKDFMWLQATVEGLSESAAAMRPLLMFRYLAACAQAGATEHPLDHPLVARLQPQMSGRHLDVFTLKESVIRPFQILQQLGMDIFENSKIDTWVIHTIWTRLANNKQGFPRKPENGGGWIDSISPLMPLFNHSCEPNVECWHDDTTTVRFFARRRIQKGEELFDSYVNVENVQLQKRQQILWPWFEGPCLCSKCSEEAVEKRGTTERGSQKSYH
ncbi:hypothetical protein B0J12DRAFT_438285 [Macrophomina phaseolina]|uniref:SET domain-containing protein n=1 Tax=Macrophomina phaseolina TaxID=35725 RepID=A0ABQ8GHL2_9PEZI|nr:hypothetical protein B0J12DRAFT_438285 [Macrophomina phaseolina]